jgi:hypothetical protein
MRKYNVIYRISTPGGIAEVPNQLNPLTYANIGDLLAKAKDNLPDQLWEDWPAADDLIGFTVAEVCEQEEKDATTPGD